MHRKDLPTIGSNAKSRVEGVNNKTKKFISKNANMVQCLDGIFKYINFKDDQMAYKQYIEVAKKTRLQIYSLDLSIRLVAGLICV